MEELLPDEEWLEQSNLEKARTELHENNPRILINQEAALAEWWRRLSLMLAEEQQQEQERDPGFWDGLKYVRHLTEKHGRDLPALLEKLRRQSVEEAGSFSRADEFPEAGGLRRTPDGQYSREMYCDAFEGALQRGDSTLWKIIEKAERWGVWEEGTHDVSRQDPSQQEQDAAGRTR